MVFDRWELRLWLFGLFMLVLGGALAGLSVAETYSLDPSNPILLVSKTVSTFYTLMLGALLMVLGAMLIVVEVERRGG
jgi:polyferredoxin